VPSLNVGTYIGLFVALLIQGIAAIFITGGLNVSEPAVFATILVMMGGSAWLGLVTHLESKNGHLRAPMGRATSSLLSLVPGFSIIGRVVMVNRLGDSFGLGALVPIAVFTEAARFAAWVLLALTVTSGSRAPFEPNSVGFSYGLGVALALVSFLHGLVFLLISFKCQRRTGHPGHCGVNAGLALVGIAVGIVVVFGASALEAWRDFQTEGNEWQDRVLDALKLMLAVFFCVGIAFPRYALRAFVCSFSIALGVLGVRLFLTAIVGPGAVLADEFRMQATLVSFPLLGVLIALLYAVAFQFRVRLMAVIGMAVGALYAGRFNIANDPEYKNS